MFRSLAAPFAEICRQKAGITLNQQQLDQFCQYGELLLEWNQRLNLTAIREPWEIMLKHFADSLLMAKYVKGVDLTDVGTGAGFPGIPLKIVRPELSLVLIDSLDKRLKFLRALIGVLELEGVELVHARAEDAGKMERFRERFSTVTARAVASLPVLLEYCLPLVKIGGTCLLPKGKKAQEEVREAEHALTVLGGKLDSVENFHLAESAEHRSLVIVQKTKTTPAAYPRRAGIPEKKPL
ncbi:MAG: 16S rRNA (guanine(527)-N(7))-methyltransferase RsmG [Peptococcaceae bacterium]|jgi:16S rRNA (guanine527-N7)-methyltransferase|nr:16S rRNA (guanine(527)-N(7))-methyltransferase RsmG [Peptococcaceae bacterium]